MYLLPYLWLSVLWEMLIFILHFYHVFSFQGKPGLPGVQGPAGPKGNKVWMSFHFVYWVNVSYRVYKYVWRIVFTHVSLTDSHVCAPCREKLELQASALQDLK